jgi:hypothetical protein
LIFTYDSVIFRAWLLRNCAAYPENIQLHRDQLMNTSIANAQTNEFDAVVADELAALRGLEELELLFVGGGDNVYSGN